MQTHHADEDFCVQQPKTFYFFPPKKLNCMHTREMRENYIIKKVQVEGKILNATLFFSCMRIKQ
jgi:hypothetical protein